MSVPEPDPEELAAMDLPSDGDNEGGRFPTYSFLTSFTREDIDPKLCDPDLPFQRLKALKMNRTLSAYQDDVCFFALQHRLCKHHRAWH